MRVYTFEIDLADIFEEAQQLLLKKHQDYGPKNISDSPGGPINGLRVRMWDKMARIRNLTNESALPHELSPQNESLRDSFLDMVNYGIIGLMVLDGKWPKG